MLYKFFNAAWFLILPFAMFTGCGWSEADYDDQGFDRGRGTLRFEANGEDFVRNGFVSMDGWELTFEQLFINLTDIKAKQVDLSAQGFSANHAGHTPGDDGGAEVQVEVPLPGIYFVDLHDPSGPTLLGVQDKVLAGNYNQVDLSIVPAVFGESEPVPPQATDQDVQDYDGYSIVLMGQAQKGAVSVDFLLMLDEEMHYYACGPNELEGLLKDDETARAELTFHFDHVFGDAGEAPGEGVNEIAVGFQPFSDIASCSGNDCELIATQQEIGLAFNGADFLTFIDALRTIGHSGEGHCHMQ